MSFIIRIRPHPGHADMPLISADQRKRICHKHWRGGLLQTAEPEAPIVNFRAIVPVEPHRGQDLPFARQQVSGQAKLVKPEMDPPLYTLARTISIWEYIHGMKGMLSGSIGVRPNHCSAPHFLDTLRASEL